MTGSWLTTADHKQLGRLYIVVSIAFLAIAGAAGAVMQAQSGIEDASALRFYNLQSTGAAALVVAPLFLGLATLLVPLQVGAARLAFPRLQSFAFWAFALGGVAHLASYTGEGPRLAGVGFSRLLLTGGGDKGHTELWIATLAVVTIAALLAAANLLATVLLHRAEGLTLARVPLFSWATLVSSAGILIAAPAFLAGLLLLYLDQHFGGHQFFDPGTVGTGVVWQHLVWYAGRPDLYLVLVPGLGAACDMVARAAGRPLVNSNVARGALAATGLLGFGAWAAGTKVADSALLPLYSPLTGAALLPVGVLVLLWLDTLRRSDRVKPDVGLAFVVAGILAMGAGVLAIVGGGFNDPTGSAWADAPMVLLTLTAPLLLAVGVIHHWSPKVVGKPANGPAAGLQLLLLLGGGLLTALGAALAGNDDQIRGVRFDSDGLAMLTAAGFVLLLLGALGVLSTAVAALRASSVAPVEDDADGLTLEWATASPPPPYNFDTIPEVRSEAPLADLRAGAAS